MRRRIVSYLIVLGNAGLVTMIGSFAGSVMGSNILVSLINLAAIIAGLSFILWLARKPRLAQGLRAAAQRRILARYGDLAPSAEALLRLDQGFALTRVTLAKGSPAVGRTLADLALKQHGIQVLAIERNGNYQPIPRGDAELRAGDLLVIYGTPAEAEDVFKPRKTEALTIIPGALDAGEVVGGDSATPS